MSRWEIRDDYRYVRLDNGLEAVLRQLDCENAIRLQMVIHAGSNAEKGYDEYGLAHGFEHMVFKGTNGNDSSTNLEYELPTIKFSERDIPLIARLFAADFNAYTKVNMTSYYFQVDPAFAKPFLQILACSLDRTRLEEEHFKSEKKAILEEMYAGKDSFVRDALKSMRKAMYRPGDPCYHPTIGYEEGLVNATSVHLKNFYNRNYHPKNATLFVTGNIKGKEEELEKWIETMFEPITRDGPVFEYWKLGNNSTPKLSVNKIIKFHTIGQTTANLIFAYRHAGGTWGKSAELLSKIWCGDKKSRLYQNLVINPQHSRDIGQISDISCFSDLDYNTGETYFILSGNRQIADHIDDWREILQNGILPQLSPTEKKIGTNWMLHKQQITSTNLSDITEEWIESHHLSRNFDTVFNFDIKQIIAEANSRINSEFMTKPFGWAYIAYPDDEAAGVHSKMSAEHSKFDTLLNDEEHMRTAALEEPHALEMFEFAYKDVDIAANTAGINFCGAGMWNCLTSPTFLSKTDVAIFPKEHKSIQLTLEGVQMAQLADLMHEAHDTSKFEENGVFGHNSSLLMAVSAPSVSKSREFIQKFGLAIGEDDGDKIRAYYRKHKARLSAENEMMVKNAKMDPMAIGTDIVEGLCSDSHYYDLEKWANERKMFDVDKAIATYNRYWTNAVYFVKSSSDGDFKKHPAETDIDVTPTRYPAPRRVSHSAETINKSVGNVPLQNPIVFLGRPGSMTREDPRYDTVRAVTEIIMFASLGSRLFVHMRERDGDVYNCSGFYGRGATEQHYGYDGVVLKVSPGHEEQAAAKAKRYLSIFRPVTTSELRAAKTMLIYNWKKTSAERNVAGFFVNKFDGDLQKTSELLPNKVQAISEVSTADVNYFMQEMVSSYNVTVNIG
tara:strand:- start:14736 stop:17423 length:2688 start_codon:yes stop_codon:yes gene_type:complete